MTSQQFRFPSPLGDEVLKPKNAQNLIALVYGKGFRPLSGMRYLNPESVQACGSVSRLSFPSPLGDEVLKPNGTPEQQEEQRKSFRPLSGMRYLNLGALRGNGITAQGSFRPLSGMRYLNRGYRRTEQDRFNAEFPSPLGDEVLKPAKAGSSFSEVESRVSVPSRG